MPRGQVRDSLSRSELPTRAYRRATASDAPLHRQPRALRQPCEPSQTASCRRGLASIHRLNVSRATRWMPVWRSLVIVLETSTTTSSVITSRCDVLAEVDTSARSYRLVTSATRPAGPTVRQSRVAPSTSSSSGYLPSAAHKAEPSVGRRRVTRRVKSTLELEQCVRDCRCRNRLSRDSALTDFCANLNQPFDIRLLDIHKRAAGCSVCRHSVRSLSPYPAERSGDPPRDGVLHSVDELHRLSRAGFEGRGPLSTGPRSSSRSSARRTETETWLLSVESRDRIRERRDEVRLFLRNVEPIDAVERGEEESAVEEIRLPSFVVRAALEGRDRLDYDNSRSHRVSGRTRRALSPSAPSVSILRKSIGRPAAWFSSTRSSLDGPNISCFGCEAVGSSSGAGSIREDSSGTGVVRPRSVTMPSRVAIGERRGSRLASAPQRALGNGAQARC